MTHYKYSDVWQLGVVLFQILFERSTLYDGAITGALNNPSMCKHVLKDSPELFNLMKSMLESDQNKRITAMDAI